MHTSALIHIFTHKNLFKENGIDKLRYDGFIRVWTHGQEFNFIENQRI